MSIPNTIEIVGGFLVPANDSHLGKWQVECQHLCHDKFLPKVATGFMKAGDVVMDIGAFNGDHTIAYSEAVGPSGNVLAVEAGALAFQCLDYNHKLFKNKNTIVYNFPISDEVGYAFEHTADMNLGASFVSVGKGLGGSDTTRTIDWMIHVYCIDRLDFIKMDIEGFEIRALRGARESLKRFRPVLLLEVSTCALSRLNANKWDLLAEVTRQGYSFEIVEPQCNLYSPEFNIICTPI